MKTFKNLFIRTKLLISFGLIWLLLLTVILVAYRNIREITRSEKDLHDNDFRIALNLLQLRSHQNHNRASMLELYITHDKTEQLALLKSIDERATAINKIIEELLNSNPDAEFLSKLKELKSSVEIYRDTRNEELKFLNMGQFAEAQKLEQGIQRERYKKIRSLILNMGEEANQDIDTQLALDMKEADTGILIFMILGVIALALSLIIVVLLNNTIAQPLSQISSVASSIASGDLSVAISKDERKDEVGILNLAFYQMVGKLRMSIKDIMEAINLLGSSASEILAATSQVAAGSAETASAISETTTTVEEVRQAAELSNQKASRVSESSQQIVQVTQDGQQAVDETVKGMHAIQNQMESIANTILRLSEQSQQIGGIIASVNDVADQSNLLSVNASIEAAKAGEHGKGFAVVAQEIKNLAQQSKQATIQVRNILSDVQKATTAAVMATEQGSKAVENGVKQSSHAGESIRKLSESTDKAVEAATQIVASSQQQVVGMEQIGLAMNNINQAGAENAASMIQAEKAAKDLHTLGQRLKVLVEQYKL